jgi:hypothetical protein
VTTKKQLLASLVLCLLTAAALLATPAAHETADRPAGVPASSWHALSPDLGLYLGPGRGSRALQPFGPQQSIEGTLMARIDGHWVAVRLSADDGPYLIEQH